MKEHFFFSFFFFLFQTSEIPSYGSVYWEHQAHWLLNLAQHFYQLGNMFDTIKCSLLINADSVEEFNESLACK